MHIVKRVTAIYSQIVIDKVFNDLEFVVEMDKDVNELWRLYGHTLSMQNKPTNDLVTAHSVTILINNHKNCHQELKKTTCTLKCRRSVLIEKSTSYFCVTSRRLYQHLINDHVLILKRSIHSFKSPRNYSKSNSRLWMQSSYASKVIAQ